MRNQTFDILKATAIISVIVGHLYAPGILRFVIYSFHVPVFFLISGYFMKKKRSLKDQIHRDWNGLLIPYIVTCLLMLLPRLYKTSLNFESVIDWLKVSFYGIPSDAVPGYRFDISQVGPIWFLLALFWSHLELRSFLNIKALKHDIRIGIIVIAIALFSLFLGYRFWFPTAVLNGAVGCIFLWIGWKIRQTHLEENFQKPIFVILCFILWLVCVFGDYSLHRHFSISVFSFPLFGLGFLGVICCFCTLYFVAKKALKLFPLFCNNLAIIGENTLGIMCVHSIDIEWLTWPRGGYATNAVLLLVRISLTIVLGIIFNRLLKYFQRKKERKKDE